MDSNAEGADIQNKQERPITHKLLGVLGKKNKNHFIIYSTGREGHNKISMANDKY